MRAAVDAGLVVSALMLTLPAVCGMPSADVSAELARPVLGAEAQLSSWRTVFAEVKRADEECDAAWRRLGTRDELQAYGRELRGP